MQWQNTSFASAAVTGRCWRCCRAWCSLPWSPRTWPWWWRMLLATLDLAAAGARSHSRFEMASRYWYLCRWAPKWVAGPGHASSTTGRSDLPNEFCGLPFISFSKEASRVRAGREAGLSACTHDLSWSRIGILFESDGISGVLRDSGQTHNHWMAAQGVDSVKSFQTKAGCLCTTEAAVSKWGAPCSWKDNVS